MVASSVLPVLMGGLVDWVILDGLVGVLRAGVGTLALFDVELGRWLEPHLILLVARRRKRCGNDRCRGRALFGVSLDRRRLEPVELRLRFADAHDLVDVANGPALTGEWQASGRLVPIEPSGA